jgi:hypothetical protein
MDERKTRDFFFVYMEVPILMYSPPVKNVLGLPSSSCDPPLFRRTPLLLEPPFQQNALPLVDEKISTLYG